MTLQGPSYGIYLSAIVRYVPEIVEPRLIYTCLLYTSPSPRDA